MKNAIPNFLTLCNLMTGCLGVVFALTGDLRLASAAIFISLIFDYLDGFAARVLHAKSAIGKELDSLADLVSFGLVPALIAYGMLNPTDHDYLTYLPFLITVFSAYRLAKFNIDTRQSVNFIGMPTPANAIFWAAFPFITMGDSSSPISRIMAPLFSDTSFLIICILATSYLLISEIRLFSLKFKNLRFSENKHRFIFLGLSAILMIIFNYFAIPFIILLYLLISIIYNKTSLKNEIQGGN